ncbi:MAG TPA: lipoyl(octanoyl) transferase LipB [Burkholderiales bacterium]|nr:lipoyl(octanoyl) transferase LipB [Burkholderiales bacterium]
MPALTSSVTRAPRAPIQVRQLGRVDYEPTWRAMQRHTASRDSDTPDEIWILEHSPVYTVGIAGRAGHLPRSDTGIALVRTDRGGQVTYHGPGQIVAYLLLDLRRRGWGVRALVRRMEQAVIDLLAGYGITARGSEDAPGVYVGGAKIAALGLRIRNGCCYHGIALNVDMDLQPFRAIDPCGYPGLVVTQLRDLGVAFDSATVASGFTRSLLATLQ